METNDNPNAEWTPQVGDRVTVPWGLGRAKAVITKNLGPLAGNWRTLWEVRATASPGNVFITHAPIEEMEPLPVVQRAKRVLGRRKVAVR